MKTIKFKTNINCSGCIAKATDTLDNTAGKGNWSVDTANPEKTLSITGEVEAEKVIKAVQSIGFKIQEVVG